MTKKGFTLIELLVVVAIIGMLASIVMTSMSEVRASARDAKRIQEIKSLQKALELYALDHDGEYPEADNIRKLDCGRPSAFTITLNELVSKDYLPQLPQDPFSVFPLCFTYITNVNDTCGGETNDYKYILTFRTEHYNSENPIRGLNVYNSNPELGYCLTNQH